jgi:hypothetical protein
MREAAILDPATLFQTMNLMRRMQAVRRQSQDARECSGADREHQQQTDGSRLRSRLTHDSPDRSYT